MQGIAITSNTERYTKNPSRKLTPRLFLLSGNTTTSDIVTDALTAFGLSAADSGHFADVLAAASSNANTNVSMMGETFKYCAPVAGSLGFSCEDTAQAIGLMANSGIKGSQSGTALRAIMTALAGDVKFCGESFGEIEIATTNTDGSMRELNDILADCRVAFAQMRIYLLERGEYSRGTF